MRFFIKEVFIPSSYVLTEASSYRVNNKYYIFLEQKLEFMQLTEMLLKI